MRRKSKSEDSLTTVIPVKNLKGNFDACNAKGICGWVIDEDNPGVPIEPDVFVDDELMTRITSDAFREDLLNVGIVMAGVLLIFLIPNKLNHKLEIREGLSGPLLNGYPKNLCYHH